MKKQITFYENKSDSIPLFTRKIDIDKKKLEKSDDKEIFIMQEFIKQVLVKMHIDY